MFSEIGFSTQCLATKAQPSTTVHISFSVTASTVIGTQNSKGTVEAKPFEVIWKAQLQAQKVSMYSMVTVNIQSADQCEAKLVVQCKQPLHFIPAAGTGIEYLLKNGLTKEAKERNCKFHLIWGVRSGTFCPVGAMVRTTKAVQPNTAWQL